MKQKLAIFIFLIFIGIDSFSQLPVIKLSSGSNIFEGSLPYGRQFKIKGSRYLPFAQAAELVTLEIRGPSYKYEAIWWYNELAKNPSDSFEFFVNRPLKFETKYISTLSFYKREKMSEEDAKSLIKDVLTEIAIEDGIKEEFKENEIKLSLETKLRRKFPSSKFVFHDHSSITSSIKLNLKSDHTIEAAKFVNRVKAYKVNQKGLSDKLKEISNKKEARQNATGVTATTLDSEIRSLNVEISGYRTNLETLKNEIDESFDEGGLPDLISNLSSQLMSIGVFKTENTVAPVSKADVEAIRLGTVYGGGLAYSKNEFYDGFSYVGIKYFFKPVDKRIADPYLSDRSFNKLALILGFLVGNDNLTFRGQELDDIGGIKPIVGLSYDINRYIAFDVGGVFFEQTSLSDLDNTSKPRASLFFGISLDADAFNRFKSLFSNESYKITK